RLAAARGAQRAAQLERVRHEAARGARPPRRRGADRPPVRAPGADDGARDRVLPRRLLRAGARRARQARGPRQAGAAGVVAARAYIVGGLSRRAPRRQRRTQAMKVWILAATLAAASTASADVVVLRMATPAPEGTAWAREGHALERDIAELTHGQVRMKWYLSGIAGDEMMMLDRIKREQLDGGASGGMTWQ